MTDYAQAHGRNGISWDEKFEMDLKYIPKITFWDDVKIVWSTAIAVLKRDGRSQEENATLENFAEYVK